MNIYEVTLNEGKINYVEHYILAEDFSDATFQAQKLLKKKFNDIPHNQEKYVWESFEIISIKKKFEVEVVK